MGVAACCGKVGVILILSSLSLTTHSQNVQEHHRNHRSKAKNNYGSRTIRRNYSEVVDEQFAAGEKAPATNTSEVRVAVCLWGMNRALPQTISSLDRHIFSPLKSMGISVDIFFHTYSLMRITSASAQEQKHPIPGAVDMLQKFLKRDLLRYEVSDQDTFDRSLDEKNPHIGVPDTFEKNMSDTFEKNILRSLYSLHRVTLLWKLEVEVQKATRPFEYSKLLYVRPDLLIVSPLDVVQLLSLKENELLTPNWGQVCSQVSNSSCENKKKGLTDRIFAAGPRIAEAFGNRLLVLKDYLSSPDGIRNGMHPGHFITWAVFERSGFGNNTHTEVEPVCSCICGLRVRSPEPRNKLNRVHEGDCNEGLNVACTAKCPSMTSSSFHEAMVLGGMSTPDISFVHIPRTGGIAVLKFLRNLLDIPTRETQKAQRNFGDITYDKCAPGNRPPFSYFSNGVCVVREPLERVVDDFCSVTEHPEVMDAAMNTYENQTAYSATCTGLNSWIPHVIAMYEQDKTVQECSLVPQWKYASRCGVVIPLAALDTGNGWPILRDFFTPPESSKHEPMESKIKAKAVKAIKSLKQGTCQVSAQCITDENKQLLVHHFRDDYANLKHIFDSSEVEPKHPTLIRLGKASDSDVCACLVTTNSASAVEEWISFHRKVGLRKVFMYNDNSTDLATERIMAREAKNGFVVPLERDDSSRAHLSWPAFQEKLFTHCADVVQRDANCDWLVAPDVDEYIVPQQESPKSLGDVLRSELPEQLQHKPFCFLLDRYTFTVEAMNLVYRPDEMGGGIMLTRSYFYRFDSKIDDKRRSIGGFPRKWILYVGAQAARNTEGVLINADGLPTTVRVHTVGSFSDCKIPQHSDRTSKLNNALHLHHYVAGSGAVQTNLVGEHDIEGKRKEHIDTMREKLADLSENMETVVDKSALNFLSKYDSRNTVYVKPLGNQTGPRCKKGNQNDCQDKTSKKKKNKKGKTNQEK